MNFTTTTGLPSNHTDTIFPWGGSYTLTNVVEPTSAATATLVRVPQPLLVGGF